MGYFSYASIALLLGLLLCYALFIRQLGPAMVILPWAVFFVSVRSSDKYFYLMAPIWLMSVATVRHRDFATAWVPRLRLRGWQVFDRMPGRAAVAALCLLPAVVLSVVAVATPQPLKMTLLNVAASPTQTTQEIDLSVTNISSHAISPHFALSNSVTVGRFWKIQTGPATLAPGETETYVLVPSGPSAEVSLRGPRIELHATSVAPETMSSVAIPLVKKSA
jgi:hypothetical protein